MSIWNWWPWKKKAAIKVAEPIVPAKVVETAPVAAPKAAKPKAERKPKVEAAPKVAKPKARVKIESMVAAPKVAKPKAEKKPEAKAKPAKKVAAKKTKP